ncbi:MAG: type II toxin-antitoxin system RatA family toxin [Bacillota bacterium]
MPYIEVTKGIDATPEIVYDLAKDMESYPKFMESVEKVETLERGDGYTITKWHTKLQGRPVVWTERDVFDDVAKRIDYSLVQGDLKKFEGAWTFQPHGDGTQVKLTVDFELGIPMFAALLNPIAVMTVRQNCESMLEAMKKQLEQNK